MHKTYKNIERFHFITNPRAQQSPSKQAHEAFSGGCMWVQLRMKNLPFDTMVSEARVSVQQANLYNATLIVNDYPEVALVTRAHGVHLGRNDMDPEMARKMLGDQAIVGGTANTWNDVLRLIEQKVDYIGLGPYRFTQTKENLSPILGLAGFRKITSRLKEMQVKIPVIGIGGILPKDAPLILEAGLHGVAVSGGVLNSEPIGENIRMFLENIKPNPTF